MTTHLEHLNIFDCDINQMSSDLNTVFHLDETEQYNYSTFLPIQSPLTLTENFATKPSIITKNSTIVKRSISPSTNLFSHDMTNYEQILVAYENKRIKTENLDLFNFLELDKQEKQLDQNTPRQELFSELKDETLQILMGKQVESVMFSGSQEKRGDMTDIQRALKQQLYNGDLIYAFNQGQDIEFELVLEKDLKTNNPIIEIPLLLIINMKPHQIDGVKFLWDRVFESTKRIAANIDNHTQLDGGGAGAILAHCMGLGKTFTTIVLLHTLFRYSKLTHIQRVLILCPLNTAINWKNEFHDWLHELEPTINVYLFSNDDIRTEHREEFFRRWHETGGVLLMGYEMYRKLTYTLDDNPYDQMRKFTKPNKKILTYEELVNIEKYRKYLRDPGPDLIICDEGHMIKNRKTGIACTLNKIRTRRRIVLTGTPMQNNLKEYYAMVNFCHPNFLGTELQFSDRFRSPIEAGQHRDSSKEDVAYMRRRVYALNRRLKPVIDRQGFEVLRLFLPPKFEYAIKIKCRPLQRLLYETYINYQNIDAIQTNLNMTQLFKDYQYLMKIWTHPWLLQPYFLEYYNQYCKDNDRIEIENVVENDINDKTSTMNETSLTYNILSLPTKTRSNEISRKNDLNAMKEQWWFKIFDPNNSQFNFELSGKFLILKAILDECESIGDKLLIFTRSLLTLDYLEQCLAYWSEQSLSSKWQKGVDYFRMDGKTPIKHRAADMKIFNDTENCRSRLFLISTIAGGLGVNLYSANRVIILDTSWNPAHDLQAMFRSYRLGQIKPVYIYRLIVHGTMEEKIYKRQITKQAMFHRVVDAKQLARHFTYDELAKLYEFDFDVEDDSMNKSDTKRIQDKILRHLIDDFSDIIISHREHDSFLIHNDEENLTVEEQIQANDEDENPFLRLRRRQNLPNVFNNILSSNSSTNNTE